MNISQPRSTAVDSVRHCIEKIKACDQEIQAWEHLNEQAAMVAAAASDQSQHDQSLHGVVIGVKDIFDTQDMPTRYGSPIYVRHQPDADAAVVTKLRENGAVILGKTVTTEFAGWTPSRTRNPRNPAYSPGGSSSGSAAAVAAGMVPVALGTQTLGSIIRPASYCGIVGFKPSYGRISRVGVRSLADSLDTVGMFATTVNDVARLYSALSASALSPGHELGNAVPRLALCRGPSWHHADDDAQTAIIDYVNRLRSSGYTVDDINLPPEFDGLPAAAKVIHDFEVRQGYAFERYHRNEGLSMSFRQGLERAAALTPTDYERATELGDICRARFPEIFAGYDAILTLAAPGEAPFGNTTTGDSVMNAFWTLLHAPCVSIPKLRGRTGLPIGLQIVATRFADVKALDAAAWLERNGT